jgi:hypothetical protein
MPDAPERFKPLSDYTPNDHMHRLRDPHWRAESDSYRAAVQAALLKAGLAVDPEPDTTDLNQMSAQDHYDAIRRR